MGGRVLPPDCPRHVLSHLRLLAKLNSSSPWGKRPQLPGHLRTPQVRPVSVPSSPAARSASEKTPLMFYAALLLPVGVRAGAKCPGLPGIAASVSCVGPSALGGRPARARVGEGRHAAGDRTKAGRGRAESRVPPRETLPLPQERMKRRVSPVRARGRPALLCGARAVAVGHFCHGSPLTAFGWPGPGSPTGCTSAAGVPPGGDRCSAGPRLSAPQTA